MIVNGPIKPSEVGKHKGVIFPVAVFEAFNAEITAKACDGVAKVSQGAVMERLVAAGLSRSEIFLRGWLNIEDAYRAVGWKVSYEKPDYNETGDSWLIFEANNV